MKCNLLLIIAGLGMFSLISCSNMKTEDSAGEIEYKPVTINKTFGMDIPSFMKAAKNLNDDASLQYQNLFKETYVIVIDEEKENFIKTFSEYGEYDSAKTAVENYRMVQMNSMSENIAINTETEAQALTINSLDAQQVQFDGTVNDANAEIAYFVTFIEGKQTLYMVMAWTLKGNKEKYRKMFDDMARSFKEL